MAIKSGPGVAAHSKTPAKGRVTSRPTTKPAGEGAVDAEAVQNQAIVINAEPVQQLVPQMEGNAEMSDAIETAKNFAEETKTRFQSAFTDFNDKTKVALEKGSKAFEELNELTKGNIDALVESGQIAAKGVEALGQDAAEYGRKSFEKTSATFKNFAGVKSPTEFFQLQSELLTSVFDTLVSETAKSSETFLKLAGDVAKPISNRVSVVSDKVKSLAA